MAMRDAENYSKITCNNIRAVSGVLTELKDKLTWDNKETILDIGCGNGDVTNKVVKRFVPGDTKIVAVDIAEEMITYCKQHYPDPNVIYEVLDIVDKNTWATLTNQQFDKVMSFFTIYRIKNDRQVYENIYELLKPGGETLHLVPTSNTIEKVYPYLAKLPKYKAYEEMLCKLKFSRNPRDDHASYARDLLKTIGFDVIICEPRKVNLEFGTLDEFIGLITIVSYLSEILPKELYEEALIDARKIIEDHKLLKEVQHGFQYFLAFTVIFAKKPC